MFPFTNWSHLYSTWLSVCLNSAAVQMLTRPSVWSVCLPAFLWITAASEAVFQFMFPTVFLWYTAVEHHASLQLDAHVVIARWGSLFTVLPVVKSNSLLVKEHISVISGEVTYNHSMMIRLHYNGLPFLKTLYSFSLLSISYGIFGLSCWN